MLNIFLQYRELLSELTKREIKQRYKQSVLGYAWVVLNPLFQMLVMAFVFSKVMRVENLGVPYSIFLYAGLLPWNLFTTTVGSATGALVNNTGLLTKVYFPREVFVASNLIAKLVDFFLASSVFVIFMIMAHIPTTANLLWIIPILAIQVIFTYALSLLVALANLFYRDIQYVTNLALLVWMYLTPVIYPTEFFPEKYHWIFKINPMSVIINAYREVILNGRGPNLGSLGMALGLSVILLLVFYKLFKKLEGVFADVV